MTTARKSKFKKIGFVLGGVIGFVVLCLALAPFFVDVNEKIKPEIIKVIEENLNVKADLGKLSLNLLWGVNIGMEQLKLTETAPNKNVLFELQNASLNIPYLSLLMGTVSVTLKTEKPVIRLIRFKDGALNVSKLMKPKAAQAEAAKEESSSGSSALGNHFSFSTDIQKAELQFKDEVSGFNYKIEDLTLKLEDVGLNRPFDILVKTNLNIDNKKDIKLQGALEFESNMEIQMTADGFQAIQLNSTLDLSAIEVKYAQLLNKSKDVALVIETKLDATKDSAKVDSFKMKAGSFEVVAAGTISNFTEPTVNLKVTSNELNLAHWKEILTPLKDLDMEGKLNLDLSVIGTAPKFQFDGKFEFKDGSLKLAALKPRITDIHMTAALSGQTVRFKNTGLKIASSDLQLDGHVTNFAAPEVDLTLKSKLLNLDEMLPPAAADKAPKKVETAGSGPAVEEAEANPFASISSNPTLKNMNLKVYAQVQKLIVKNATVQDLNADIYFKDLIFTLKNASLKAFQGTAKAFLQLDLNSTAPSYQFTSDVNGIDINQAIVSQFKELDKSLTGKANGNIIMSGVGLNSAQLRRNLKGSGKFNIKDGAWSGAVPLKKIGEKLAKIPKVGEKLSEIKVDDRFKVFNIDFMIQSGVLNIQKVFIDTLQNNTAIESSGTIDFDQNLRMKGNIIAPIKDAPKDLKTADGRAKIPFELEGKATAPSVEWEKTIQVIGKAYAKDEGKKLLNKGLEKVQDKLGDDVKKLFKGFKF